jgi:hypothetical protein
VNAPPAIVVCTTNARCLAVMQASIAAYVPKDVEVLLFRNVGSSFGEAYNYGVREAFRTHESVVVCNDDIVFTPTTWDTLMADVGHLRLHIPDLGWVTTRSDYARGGQNIRCGTGKIVALRYESEQHILRTDIIAPICAWIHRDAWIDFPPINWFSDDVQCLEMKRQHFVSRAYVHHVGSQTCGTDVAKCFAEAEPWLRANRPALHARWYLTKGQ